MHTSLKSLNLSNPLMSNSKNGASAAARNRVLAAVAIFLLGFVAGVAFTVYRGVVPTQVAAEGGGHPAAHDEDMHRLIADLEKEIAAGADSAEVWTRLGNLYFDTGQPQKAIAAYEKSLAKKPGDANVLTDLGVMYRKAGEPRQAIAKFEEAMRQDPKHLPSRYNKGIVLAGDLGDFQGAIASWEEMLRIDPQATNGSGVAIGELIEKLKKEAAAVKKP